MTARPAALLLLAALLAAAADPPVAVAEDEAPDALPTENAAIGALIGRTVHTVDGQEIGILSDVLADGEGTPQVAVIDADSFFAVDGGQLGLPWRELRQRDGRLVAPLDSATAERALEGAPVRSPTPPDNRR